MVHNKYMTLGVFCISTFLQGAAGGSSDQMPHLGSSDERLQFADCFTRKTVSMPNAERFYENIIMAQPSVERDKLVFCVGTIASPNEQMTQTMAAKITAFISTSLGRKPILEEIAEMDRGMGACLRETERVFPALTAILDDYFRKRSDRERSRLSGGVELNFCWYQSVDDARSLALLKKGRYFPSTHPLKFVAQYVFDNALSIDIHCVRRMEEGGRELQKMAERGLILPTELMSVIKPFVDPFSTALPKQQEVFNQKDLTAAAMLLTLRQKTQTLCEGETSVHEVPVLEFQPEIYAQYLEQASVDLKKPSDNICVIN